MTSQQPSSDASQPASADVLPTEDTLKPVETFRIANPPQTGSHGYASQATADQGVQNALPGNVNEQNPAFAPRLGGALQWHRDRRDYHAYTGHNDASGRAEPSTGVMNDLFTIGDYESVEPAPSPSHALTSRNDVDTRDTIGTERSFSAQPEASQSASGSPTTTGASHHLAEEQDLEVDDFDIDSAMGSDGQSISTSLAESMYDFRQEFGRTYHAYKDGKYIFPNDEREADRLDLQHHLFAKTFGNKLYFAPLNEPKHCLDVGTGTGIWAIDFADLHPECQVLGIDLSPGQPQLVPPNLKFIVDDAEDSWEHPVPFDYIHARLMAGCFADWQNFFRQAYDNLEPGGWLELQDYGLPVKSADGTANGTELMRWGELLCAAARKLGRPMGSDVSDMYEQWMTEVGFVDVQQRMFMWPSNGWPKDPRMKELGRWNMVNIIDGLEGFCLALLTRAFDWKKEEVDVFVAKVTRDLSDRSIHAYFPMPVTFGRKPFAGEVAFR